MSFLKAMHCAGITLLLLTFCVGATAANTRSVVQEVESQLHDYFANQYAYASINIVLNSKNNHFNAKKCADLSISPPKALTRGGRITVRVACDHPKRWVTHLTGKVSLLAPVAIANNTLPKGKVVAAHDIAFKIKDLTTLKAGYFLAPNGLIGSRIRRTVTSKNVLNSQHVQLPNIVNKGDSVMIIATQRGMSVRTQGTALDGGFQNDQIRVLNNRSQKVIKAYIKARGQVVVF